jgi:hypothetical protein
MKKAQAWGIIRWDERGRRICVGVKASIKEAEAMAEGMVKTFPDMHIIIKRCNCEIHGCCNNTFPCMGDEGVQ